MKQLLIPLLPPPAPQAVRQDVRNLHLEVLQQFHQAQVRGAWGLVLFTTTAFDV